MKIPDYMIIGVAKSGTTSLHEMLIQHPQILRHKKGHFKNKYVEPHFFDICYEKGIKWYKNLFINKKETITGEKSVAYLFYPEISKEIKTHCPNTKFIVILRNPIERAFSHYNWQYQLGKKEIGYTFEEVLELEDKINPNNWEDLKDYSYKARGRYAEQLKRWYIYFPNKNQTLILDYKDLKEKPQKVMNKVFKFLGVTSFKIKPIYKNQTKYSSSLKEKTRKELQKYFEPYNKELYKLIGKNFNWENK